MRPRQFLRQSLLAFAALLAGPAAAETAPPPEGVTAIELIEGWRRADGAHVAAIAIRLAPGWHTYWRAPLTGIPPQFDWSASGNLAAVAYEWPRPELFDSAGARTIGYKKALVLPVVLTPRTEGAPVEADVFVAFGVCRDICIPSEARLTATLDPDAAPVSGAAGRAEIERALAARPLDPREAGVTSAACALGADAEGHTLTADIEFRAPPAPGLFAVIEAAGRPDLWIGVPETRTAGHAVHARARLAATGAGGLALDREGLRVTLLDGRRAIDIKGCAG